MAEETIDIILPTYHPNLILLKRALESIINQDYTNWVLYLIQDGNEMDVLNLANSFNDSRIRYLEIPHSGKAAALNYALKQGDSKYIAYQDDDDIWYPNHLSECISYMKANDAKFVHSDAYEVFISVTNENEYEETSRQKLHRGLVTDITLMAISHINVMHERELLDKVGDYDTSLSFYIDWDMFQRFACKTIPHHISTYTCEHYIFTNKEGVNINRISSANQNDPKLREEKIREMFVKSLVFLTEDTYFILLRDWQKKVYLLNKQELAFKEELNKSLKKQEQTSKEELQKNLNKQEQAYKEELNKILKRQEQTYMEELQKNLKKQEQTYKEELDKNLKKQEQAYKEEFNKNFKKQEQTYMEELQKKNKEIEQIYSSNSWRITKPFRILLKLFQRN